MNKMNIFKNCKDCKHFDHVHSSYPNKTDGLCLRLGLNKNIVSDILADAFITFAQDQNPSFVRVGYNFGCIHFQEIEVKK